ncbi:MAG TPA: DUF3137 domain-containing protein [Enteractinococcus helveticum]|uniref:DUF3137 domain-containing protein n=1 Tax=Enteractinococcus helveticum TaxID=1837282 RepID=A0A921FNR2_9MICC|nr:DUF3137 domain-containing protein [Enteractinococcus helveticum]HJF14327.1 DUF3137 domain-containing protein [Enteractinococcus helveticum]
MSSHPKISVPSFDSVWSEVRKSSTKITNDTSWLTTWNAKSIGLFIPVFIGLGLVVLSMLFFFIDYAVFGLLALVVAILCIAPPVVYVMNLMAKASGKYSQTVVAPMIEALIGQLSARTVTGSESKLQATYDPDGGIPKSILANSGFIMDAKATQEDYIRGTFGETDFMISDVKWQTSEIELSAEAKERIARRQESERKQRERERDRQLRREHGSDWRRYKRIEDYRNSSGSSLIDLLPDSLVNQVKEKYSRFEEHTKRIGPSMVVFVADFHKDFTSRTYLLPRKEETQAIRSFSEKTGLEPMILEDPGITERFYGWTTDQVEARYLLTPELILAINDAAERMDSERIAVSFKGSRMYFAVVMDDDRFSLNFKNNNDDGYQMAQDIYNDLVAFISLIEHFNLNTRIWTKA